MPARPGPSAVSAIRSSSRPVVCADPRRTASPRSDPGRVHAEDGRRLIEDVCRCRPQRQQPADQRQQPRRSRRAPSGRRVDDRRAHAARKPRPTRAAPANASRDRGGSALVLPDVSTMHVHQRDPGSLQQGGRQHGQRRASGDAFERIGRLPIGIESIPGTRHAQRARMGAPLGRPPVRMRRLSTG